MNDLDLVTVAVFSLRHEAEIARARLASEGIPALVQADDEGGLNPGFFAEYGVRLVVRSEQREAAELALQRPDEPTAPSVVCHRDHVEAMVAQARFVAPEEACGLLAFDMAGRLRFVYPLSNVDRSPHRFTIDPTEHFRALQHAERNGWDIAGTFHSHPHGAARPSATDIGAFDQDWVHVIVGSLADADPEVSVYTIDGDSAVEVSVAVRSDRYAAPHGR